MELSNLIDDIKSGKFNLIFYFVCLLLFYHIYNKLLECCKTTESMADITDAQIADAVKKYYLSDEFVKNISIVAAQSQQNGLKVSGNLEVSGGFNLLPRGTIVAFNSAQAPPGWALCDGTNGTPDLRGRFIRMQSDSLGGFNDWGGKLVDGNKMTYNKNLGGNSRDDVKSWILNHKFGDQAGTDQHVLHINELPAHVHKVNDWADWAGGGGQNNYHGNVYHRGAWYAREQDQNGGPENYNALYDSDSAPAGAGWTHNNQPPYYVLSYIMKL